MRSNESSSTANIARVMLRYLQARAAVLRPSTVSSLCDALTVFGEHLTVTHPEITSLRQLDRRHIEDFLRPTPADGGAAGWRVTSRCPRPWCTPRCSQSGTSSTTSPPGAGPN